MSLPRTSTARIDLRSDTVTQPTPAMREAMAEARLGDDVYGEDPTVNRLEAAAAQRLGKEAAVFVPSGTMGNLLAMMAHCPRGKKVLVGDASDIWLWEAGGASVLGGLVLHPVATGPRGEIAEADLDAASAVPDDPQCAEPGLVCLEDTHCMSSGAVLSLGYLQRIAGFCVQRGLPLHLDGARLWNAAVALGVSPAAIAGHADSVMVCLSKGLAAPVGSLVAGGGPFIARVRRLRKMVGGGMRQAGVLAAAGLVALESMVERLAEDHRLARRLWAGQREIPGVAVDAEPPATNIVFFSLADPTLSVSAFIDGLAGNDVAVGELGAGRIRAVTHYGITREDIERTLAAVQEVFAVGAATSARSARSARAAQ
jgi:threonine aldolase